MPTDAELLARYVKTRDESAFAELVRRHLGLVYGAALRRTGGRTHLAEEIAQKVFCDLARKASGLRGHPMLTGWLYHSTRLTALHALRTEARRSQLNQSYAVMTDDAPRPEDQLAWTQLRPVLDEAMDRLGERDREAMLLRYFEGLSFAEVGARLTLSENAARMRTERALEKLRAHLGRRGVTSTAAALGLLLANQAFAQAPASLATSVTSSALAVAPAGASATFFSSLLLHKSAAAIFGAACAVPITLLAWSALPGDVSDAELAALRAENARLKAVSAGGASAAALAIVADKSIEQSTLLLQSIAKRLERNHPAESSGHRNHGQATPFEAFLTYIWAIDAGESEALENILTYDAKGRAAIQALHASLPPTIRASYPTPEKFVVFLYLADTILRPIKGADMMEDYAATVIASDRAIVRRKNADHGGMMWVQTGKGWKIVVPSGYPEFLAKRILGNEMLEKLGSNEAIRR